MKSGFHGNEIRTTDLGPALGRLTDLRLLAWDGADIAWVQAQAPGQYPQTWRVSLAPGGPAPAKLFRTDAGTVQANVTVQQLTPEVAIGGRIEAASAPSYPWWQPERVRWFLAGVWLYALIAGGIAVLVVIRGLRRRAAT